MMTSRSDLLALASIPIISALIGWITNYIAVKMLFRPHAPVRFLGLTVHGLVPRRQREIAQSLGRMIERDLISHRDFQAVLQSKETAQEASRFLSEQVDAFVVRLTAQNPMIGAFLQGPLLEQIKTALSSQISERSPELISRAVEKIEGGLDIQAIVQKKIEAFDLTKLEGIIYEISARELKTIEILGGVLGFLVGLGQVALMVAIG